MAFAGSLCWCRKTSLPPPAALHSRLPLLRTDTCLPHAICPDCPDPSRLDSTRHLLTYYPEH